MVVVVDLVVQKRLDCFHQRLSTHDRPVDRVFRKAIPNDEIDGTAFTIGSR